MNKKNDFKEFSDKQLIIADLKNKNKEIQATSDKISKDVDKCEQNYFNRITFKQKMISFIKSE